MHQLQLHRAAVTVLGLRPDGDGLHRETLGVGGEDLKPVVTVA